MNILFPLLSLMIMSFSISAQEVVSVPQIYDVNSAKKDFIREVSLFSRQLYSSGPRTAIAPMGGSKITPVLELDLDQLVIVTDSYPGTPYDIKRQFQGGSYELKRVLEGALRSGSMSTNDVIGVNLGAQILARLKLEMGVQEVTMKYWTDRRSFEVRGHQVMRDRKLSKSDIPVATTFDFKIGNRDIQIVLISAFILPDSAGSKAGLPKFISHYKPSEGFHWAYLSADGLGFFSANPKNGLSQANEDLLNIIKTKGSVLLDYPTDNAFHTPEVSGGIRFMEGRKDLKEIPDMREIKMFRVERPGIFGYCLKTGDEVRVYQKVYSPKILSPRLEPLKQIGSEVKWILR